MPSISERQKADRRKSYREALETLEKAKQNIDTKTKEGKSLRDQELRFLDHYPETRKKFEMLIAESLEDDKGLPEGKLKELVEKFEWMIAIGKPEDVIEAVGLYRCSKCNELHHKEMDKCMYELYQELVKSNEESENIEDEEDDNKEES